MTVAHTATGGGTSLEQLALAAGVLLLGFAFLVQKTVDRRVSIALVVLGLFAFVGAFTFFNASEPSVTVDGRRLTESDANDAIRALCVARDAAGDVAAARSAFEDRAHGPLHDIAAAIEDDDRDLAARLLVAKQAVEADLTVSRDPEQLADDLDRLVDATIVAVDALGMEATTC